MNDGAVDEVPAEENKDSDQIEVQTVLQPAILTGSTNPLLMKLSPQKMRPESEDRGSVSSSKTGAKNAPPTSPHKKSKSALYTMLENGMMNASFNSDLAKSFDS